MTRPELPPSPGHPTPPPCWSVVVRIIVAIGITVSALLLAVKFSGSVDPTAHATLVTRVLIGLALSALVTVVIVVLVRVAGRRSLSVLGIATVAGDLRAFGLGIAVWAVPAAATFFVFALRGTALQITAPATEFWLVFGLLFFAVLLTEAIPEELVFRGYVFAVLAERLSPWRVIWVQTVLFLVTAILLQSDFDPVDISLFAAMGFVLGYVRLVTGSVWVAVGIHVAFQTASQLVFTHNIIEFDGSPVLAMIALGVVPFTAAAVLLPMCFSLKTRG